MIMTLIPMLMKILIKTQTSHRKQIHFHVEIESQSSTNHNRATLRTDAKNGNDATGASSTITQNRCWRKKSLTINPSNLPLIAQVKLLQQPLLMHFKFFLMRR